MSNRTLTELHQELQEGFKKGNDYNKNDFKEYLELVIYSLVSEKDSFFGPFIIKLHRVIDDKLTAPAAVSMNNMGFNLHVNPKMLVIYSIEEVKAILIHEMYHIINNHLVRAKSHGNKYPHEFVNIAMDCAINQYIDELPEGCITLDFVEEQFKTGKLLEKESYEYYLNEMDKYRNTDEYKEFEAKMKSFVNELEDMLNNGVPKESNGSGKDGKDNESDQGNSKGESGKGDNRPATAKDIEELLEKYGLNSGSLSINNPEIEGDKSKTIPEEVAKSLINDLVEDALRASRGRTPAGVERALEYLRHKPLISWKSEFKKMVGSISVPYKKTFLRPSRRLPKRADIRGRMMDKEVSISVAIDTSGSQTEEQIAYIINEVFHMLKGVKHKIRIIECDYEVQRDYTVKNKNQVDKKVKGGGGTALSPVINLLNNDKSKDKPDLLVYFTDGYAESTLDNPPRGYRVLWVLIDGSTRISLDKPHGPVRILDTNNSK